MFTSTNKPRIGNISADADAAFMEELKKKDRPRYLRLIEANQKQVLKPRRLKRGEARPQTTDSKGQFLDKNDLQPILASPDADHGLGAKKPTSEAAQ